MSSVPAREAYEAPKTQDAKPAPERKQLDPLLSSIFLGAAATVLSVENPINIEFQPRLLETLAVCALGVVLLAWANLRPNLIVLFSGAALLLGTVSVGTISQPAQVNLPLSAVLPLRLAIVLLVAFAWAFLLQPPAWLGRALAAISIPTAAVLLLFIVPQVSAQVFHWGAYRPINNKFAPYWLTPDRHGGVYATDLDGVYVWAFDSTGSPQGTLNPAKAPAVGTPGPGIIPSGMENELNSPSFKLLATTPTPVIMSGTPVPRSAISNFDFCGIATDPVGNLYMVDLYDPAGYRLLRFNSGGDITARWPAPDKYQPTSSCLAADSQYIYLSAIDGTQRGIIYILDHDGTVDGQVSVDFLPMGISANDSATLAGNGMKSVVIMSAGSLHLLSVPVASPHSARVSALPAPPQPLQVPILLTRSNEVLLSDHQSLTVSRYNPATGKVVGTIGKSGTLPGEFGDIGGMTEEAGGMLFVADPINRVIDKFYPDGRISSVWWAQSLNGEVEQEGR